MTVRLCDPPVEAASATLTLAPLDVPLCVEVGWAPEPNAVAAACRGWEGRADPQTAPLRLRIELSSTLACTGDTAMQVDGGKVAIRGPGVLAHAALDQGFARCIVSREYLRDADALRQEVLEPLVLMLLTRRDRTPLHASGFVAGGVAVLLAGRSGAGKSCLARAADMAGLQVLSDDAVFVQLSPCLRVWGWPTAANLLEEDASDAKGPVRRRNGKVKRVMLLRSASSSPIRGEQVALCLLSRGRKPVLSRISAAEVHERLWPLDEGFDLLPDLIAAAVARLSACGAWDLRLSTNPADAIRLLVANLPRLRESAAR